MKSFSVGDVSLALSRQWSECGFCGTLLTSGIWTTSLPNRCWWSSVSHRLKSGHELKQKDCVGGFKPPDSTTKVWFLHLSERSVQKCLHGGVSRNVAQSVNLCSSIQETITLSRSCFMPHLCSWVPWITHRFSGICSKYAPCLPLLLDALSLWLMTDIRVPNVPCRTL